jgi:proteasome accessory factor C
MSDRIDFATRFQRLLALLRSAAARGDEGVPYGELAAQFGLTDRQLIRELETASMIGADDAHYDEMPFEVILDDDRVSVRLFSLKEPLRLTPREGLLLVASADALAGDDDDESPLRRALVKVATVLGLEPGETIDVDADLDGGPFGLLLTEAVTSRRLVTFRYWSYGRDEVAERRVDPWAVFAADGAWYLVGRDLVADAERRFRLDRMSEVEVLDQAAGGLPPTVDRSVTGLPDAARVVLALPSEARWVAEHVPTTSVAEGPDGGLVVELAVTDRSWLERLLLRIGPAARVVEIDPALGTPDVLPGAARRILERYRVRGATGTAR